MEHHEFANLALRSVLGPRQYQAAMSVGTTMRQEDVVNEAADLLREFGSHAQDGL